MRHTKSRKTVSYETTETLYVNTIWVDNLPFRLDSFAFPNASIPFRLISLGIIRILFKPGMRIGKTYFILVSKE